MTELPSNDYISQINQNGSGLNIPQIVNAIVDAEITPVRAPVVKQQEQVEASISGMAELKASAELTNKNIANLKSTDVSIETRSSDTDVLTVAVTDQSELQVGVSKITAISQLAQAHSHSIPAVGSSPATFGSADAGLPEDYRLKIRLGTYNLTAGGQTFTPNATDPDIPEIQFSAGESITAVAVKLDQIEGINAKVVNTTGSNFKIMITGETGLDNAFEIETRPLTFTHADIVNGQTYTVASNTGGEIDAEDIVSGRDYQIISTDGDLVNATGIAVNQEYTIVSTDGTTGSANTTINNSSWYKIVNTDSGATSSAATIKNNAWYKSLDADQNVPTAASAVGLNKYYRHSGAGTINGDTDWTLFGWDGVSAIFKVTTIPLVAQRGTSSAVETTDFTRFGWDGVATTFQANVNGAGVSNPGPGRVVQYTNYQADFGAAVGATQFQANATANFNTSGPGQVTPFTNYAADFGWDGGSATFIANKNAAATGGAGPGVVRSYTDFTRHFTNAESGRAGAVNISNAAGTIFTADSHGTAVYGTGRVRPFTDYTKYGMGGDKLIDQAGVQFTANKIGQTAGHADYGDGSVNTISEHDTGNNNYRIFDTWSDYRDVNSLRAQDLSAQDIIFDLNGLEVKRETNIVTDVVPGASFEILKTSTVGAEIITGADKESLMLTVQSFIDELNAYRADLKALSRSDRTGGDPGQLYGNPYVKSRLRALSEFMLKPIKGYTTFPEDNPVYLSQLGFKTQKDGTYGLDQKAFDTTFNNAPGNFDALTKDHALSKHPEISVVWDPGGGTEAGIYQFHHDDGIGGGGDGSGNVIYAGTVNGGGARLYRAAAGGGSFSYDGTNVNSTGDFPGLFLRTTSNNLGDDVPMNVHLGRSFATLFAEFHDDVLNDRYIHRRQVQNIEIQNEMLLDRIARLDLRSDSLAQSYNAEFQMMEDMVTSFKSTGDYLTGVVDAWNK
jgi:flagellar capping protein FliD